MQGTHCERSCSILLRGHLLPNATERLVCEMMLRFRATILSFCMFFCVACDSNEGVTPLMMAAESGNTTELKQLITDGADLNEKSDYNWTALIFASNRGHEDAVVLLVEAGADVNAASIKIRPRAFATSGGYPPSNALAESIHEGHLSIATFLIDSGAAIDAYSLALAGRQGNIALLEKMVALGGDLNRVSSSGFHHSALSVAASVGDTKMIKWLLDHGADPNLPLPYSTILSKAVQGNQTEAVALLIDRGANPNQTSGSANYTALYYALHNSRAHESYSRSLRVIEILLEKGADPNHRIKNQEISFLEQVKISLARSYDGIKDPNYDETIRGRYRESIEYEKAVLALLETHLK